VTAPQALIVLIHHGDAVPAEIDTQRPLSAHGRQTIERLAEVARDRGVRPDVVWHSGKLRAKQTAEILWLACNPLAEFAAIRGLRPDDPPGIVRDRLLGETRTVMLAGHLPQLARLLELLEPAAPPFPPHGMVALGAAGASEWRESWRAGDA
jgi:phosphohistidine phosphatase